MGARRVTGARALLAAPLVAAAGLAVATLLGSGPAPSAEAAAGGVAAAAPTTDGAGGSGAADGPSAAGSLELGAELFATQCSSCHGLDARGVEGRGPTLETEGGAAADFVLRTGRMPLAAPDLQARSGPVRYSEEEITALVAYVASIGDGPDVPVVDLAFGDVGRGGQLYRLNCAACHVASGAGAPIGGGREAPNLVSATPTEVAEAILVGPGAMPVFGSLTDTDIADIATYVRQLDEEGTTSPSSFGGAGPVAEGLAAFILGLVPLVALTRWIGAPKEGRDDPPPSDDLDDLAYPIDEREGDEHDDRRDGGQGDRRDGGPDGRRDGGPDDRRDGGPDGRRDGGPDEHEGAREVAT